MANIRWVRASMVVVLAGCASGGSAARPVRSSARVEPQNANSPSNANAPVDPAAAMSLPQLPSSRQPAMSQAPERRIKLLEVQPGTPIAKAVEQVASLLGLGVSVDPEVRGTTSGVLRNVTLDSALAELVGRRGYAYQVQGTVLRVVPIKMQTRTFSLDYVALSRVGTMSTVVQRRLSNNFAGGGMQAGLASGFNGQGSGMANGAGSGADVLTAQSVADIWQEIRVAISGILQAGQATRAAQTEQSSAAANAGNAGGSGASGNGATSVAFSDGSTVVVSPISGLISVTAMPEKLRAVEAFIDDFQASVLRQVSIEAKIVEVNLNNTFQFGIDWSTITTAGSHSFSLRTDPTVQTTGNAGNINFVLNDGTTSINAVLTALTSQGTINVLSNERTTALNNQRAIFNVTSDEVFFYVTRAPLFGANGGVVSFQNQVIPQQVSVGVVLDVLPQISADNVLTMDIRPAVTTISRVDSISLADGTSATAPVIARREGDTIARLRAGETMVIGGLVQTRKENTTGGIPVLKDIPLIGWLFKRIKQVDNRTELVIFLTPTIISGAPSTGGGR